MISCPEALIQERETHKPGLMTFICNKVNSLLSLSLSSLVLKTIAAKPCFQDEWISPK